MNKGSGENVGWGGNPFGTMTQPTERRNARLAVLLAVRLSDYLRGLTFHTEFGASAVFVDENEEDEEEDASEARQAHGDGDLREVKSDCQRITSKSVPGEGSLYAGKIRV